MTGIKKINKLYVALAIFISSFLGILFLSKVSPLFPWYMNDDSDIFMTIGKYWASGEAIPYIDLFDHKGPIIFFINAVGFFIGGGEMYGVAVVEVIFLMISEYYAYKILNLRFNQKASLLLALLMPALFIYNFVPGNFTEEYMLPFLFASFYYCLKWQMSGIVEHKPIYALLYGLAFGFALMTRVTNALSICLLVLCVVVILIKNKKWKNLLDNALLFIAGALIMIIPFCIYFYLKDALYDMWYATLLYNFDYTSNSGLTFEFTLKDIISLIRMTFAGLLAVAVCFYKGIIKKEKNSLFWLVVALPSTLFMYMLNRYANYSLIIFPLLYIAFYEIYDINIEKKLKKLFIYTVIIFLLLSSLVKIRKLFNENDIKNNKRAEYETLIDLIPEKEKNNNFIAFDMPVDLYLIEDIKPSSKYFIFQSWQASNSKKLTNLIIEEYKTNNSIHYLLCSYIPEIISDIINDDFLLVSSNGYYNLYKRVK